jgi:hypothetical protein
MQRADFDEFAQLLDDAYDLLGVGAANKVISGGAKGMFFAALAAYPMATVRAALGAHCARGKFPPRPGDVIDIIEASAANDGRPGVEEAWAIALTSRDESDTVVWTAECAEAFAICRPILNLDDEVGARMAFKEAYARIVGQARAAHRPAAWSASIGWDSGKRDGALSRAVVAGLLPAPEATTLLLGGPADMPPPDDKARAQLAAIKQMLADRAAQREANSEAAHEQRIEADRAEKATLQQRVDDHIREEKARMRGLRSGANAPPA